jgi:hypothetical protein
MKKFLLISFLFPLILSFSNAELVVVDPCYASNFNCSFTGPMYIIAEVPECEDCYFRFQYYIRECDEFKQIQITAWELTEESDQSCLECDFSSIFQAGIIAIWNYNVMNWTKHENGNWCHLNHVAGIYSCMEYNSNYTPPNLIYGKTNSKNNSNMEGTVRQFYPCDESCCSAFYEVCFNPVTGNVASITYLSYLAYSTICDSQNPNCQPVCDELDFDYYSIQIPIHYNKEKKYEYENNSNEEISIIPNPSSNSMEAILSLNEKGPIEIVITDNIGNIVITKKSFKTQNEFSEIIDLNNLASGKYFILMSINSQIHRKSFYIKK